MLKITAIASLILLYTLSGCSEKSEKYGFKCEGQVLISANTSCKNHSIEFTLVTTDKLEASHEPCISRILFDKLQVYKDTNIDKEWVWNGEDLSGKKITQSFSIDKVTGEFSITEYETQTLGMSRLAVSGSCKKIQKILQ